MTIFDELIQKTYDLLPQGGKHTTALPDPASHQGKRSELILGKETAFELGGGNAPCTSCIMYTENEDLVPRDEVVVYGPDLTQLKADCAFARIALIRTDYIEAQGEQGAYGILENIGLRKYDVFPKGYMVRTSALSNREQIRVSKTAVKEKLTFAHVGSIYISEFHKNEHVQAVKMIFVTLPDFDYRKLDHLGTLSLEVFRALNHMLTDLKMDCKACEWKIVCDEVEGMKTLHQERLSKEQKNKQEELS